ncbi:hypothetical protein [Pseudophaeobacter sp. A-200-2]|uniref:hypothetical protein n=1 Tax=Pseudophaeobacter sp. A-200-2 TaxID=3098145 RepID=UPI0034D3E383
MDFWRKDFSKKQVSFILEKVKEIRIVGDDGRISFKGGAYDGWFAVLVSAIELEVKSDALRNQIVRAALSSPELVAGFTEKDFRGVVWKLRQIYKNENQKIHRVAFPVWNLPKISSGNEEGGRHNLEFFAIPKYTDI